MGWRERVFGFFERRGRGLVGDAVGDFMDRGFVRQPKSLKTYQKYYEDDATVGVSVDTISEMVIPSFYLTIKDDKNAKSKKALEVCLKLKENLHLEERLLNVEKCTHIYGFCPVERVISGSKGIVQLVVYDPKSFEYQRKGGDEFTGFKQYKPDGGHIDFKPDEIIWYVNNQAGNGPKAMYGISDVQRILHLLEVRDQVIENIGSIMKNVARPPTIWKTKSPNDQQTLKTILKDAKDAGGDVVVYPLDAVQFETVKVDNRSPYWEYVDYIDGLIFQGLHSPMLNYLRNATEASATKMVEIIQRHVEGRQRYQKIMLENEVFRVHLDRVGLEDAETPQVNWGKPFELGQKLNIGVFLEKGLDLGYIQPDQYYDILRQLGLTLAVPNPGADDPNGQGEPAPEGGLPAAGGRQITVTPQKTPPSEEPLKELRERFIVERVASRTD